MEVNFEKLIQDIKSGQSFFITGPAGVGKTYLLKAIHERLKKDENGVILTSTTGINALNLGGITVHKLFGLQNRTDKGYIGFMKSSFLFSGIRQRLTHVDTIIIDEVSMLRADTFELINEILRQATGNDKPFGGKVMIFTGDFFQIPPVIKSWEKNQSQWLFESSSWVGGNIKPIVLTEVHRQSDKSFIKFLNDIRTGKWNETMVKTLEQCKKNKLPEDTTIFFSTNEECDEWNKTKLASLPGKEYTYMAEITGKRNKRFAHDKESIARDCIAKVELKLKVGTRVIAVVNDKKERFVNGSVGFVTELSDAKGKQFVKVLFEGDKESTKIIKHVWNKLNFKGKRTASFKQIPVIPAYALTIHKSQGMTLDTAIVDCKNIFACGQLYVALSRVKNINGLKIINFDKSQILTNPTVKDYYDSLK